jgi:hypothetical protein
MDKDNGEDTKVVMVKPEVHITPGANGQMRLESTIPPAETKNLLIQMLAAMVEQEHKAQSKQSRIIKPEQAGLAVVKH